MDEIGHILKKQNKIKVWTDVNRNGNRRNKNVEFNISINKNNNENIIATDGNYSYNKELLNGSIFVW